MQQLADIATKRWGKKLSSDKLKKNYTYLVIFTILVTKVWREIKAKYLAQK